MAISGTTGAHIPTLTLILVPEVQVAHRAIQEAIGRLRQVTSRATQGHIRVTAPTEARFGAGSRSMELAVRKGWQFMSALCLRTC